MGKNQTKNKVSRENQRRKNDLGILGQRGEEKENIRFIKGKVERKIKGRRIRIGRVVTVAGKSLTPLSGKSQKFCNETWLEKQEVTLLNL